MSKIPMLLNVCVDLNRHYVHNRYISRQYFHCIHTTLNYTMHTHTNTHIIFTCTYIYHTETFVKTRSFAAAWVTHSRAHHVCPLHDPARVACCLSMPRIYATWT